MGLVLPSVFWVAGGVDVALEPASPAASGRPSLFILFSPRGDENTELDGAVGRM